MALTTMTKCPVCEGPAPKDGACGACESDLSVLAGVNHIALGYYNRGLSLAKEEGASEPAIGQLQAAIAADPTHAPSRILLGKLMAQRGDFGRARQFFESVLESAFAGPEERRKASEALARIDAIVAERREAEEAAGEDQLARERRSARRRLLTLTAAVAAAVAASTAATVLVLRLPPSPAASARAVQAALDSSPALHLLGLKASNANGTVALAGTVATVDQRELAETLARAAGRGAQIDDRSLTVDKAAMTAGLRRLLVAVPHAFRSRVPVPVVDLLDAAAGSRVELERGPGDGLRLSGTVPLAEIKPLVRELAAGMAGGRPVDDSAVQVSDPYVEYAIRSGDAPESIARTLCGSARRLPSLRAFSGNADVLARMRVGSTLRIPKRLLARSPRVSRLVKENQQ